VRVVAVIAARTTSARLPAKVLAEIAGLTLLEHVVQRARRALTVDEAIVATSLDAGDDVIAALCRERGIACSRGDRDDVLDRVYRAALHHAAAVVVRVTGDCPLLDPRIVDRVVQALLHGPFDYASNTLECTYPDGLDVEAIRLPTLTQAWREAQLPSQREHVTPYITGHPERFSLHNVRHEEDLSGLRWTVDYAEDVELMRTIYARCGPGPFGMHQVLAALRADPRLSEINQCHSRNQAYQQSLQNDPTPAAPQPVRRPRRPRRSPSST
jgi:spore coat polysaccharide biosynthesis protein SpsF